MKERRACARGRASHVDACARVDIQIGRVNLRVRATTSWLSTFTLARVPWPVWRRRCSICDYEGLGRTYLLASWSRDTTPAARDV